MKKIRLPEDIELKDKVVTINRVTKVVKGGRRFKFSALVVVGDQNGIVGFGLGKSKEVPDAIRKAIYKAKHNLIKVPLKETTIPHPIIGRFKATKVVLKPAAKGTGVIAGHPVRAVMDMVGVQDILTKIIGSKNPINAVKATINGLAQLKSPEEVAILRNKPVEEIL